MAAHSTVKKLTTDWIAKGDKEASCFNQFISYWIAFNAFYSYWTSQPSDRNAINALIADNTISGTYSSLVVPNENKFKKLKAVCPVHNVGRPGQSLFLTNLNDMGEVINLLYLIRCNLFHGDKGETENRDLEVIQAATPVLEVIAKAFVNGHL